MLLAASLFNLLAATLCFDMLTLGYSIENYYYYYYWVSCWKKNVTYTYNLLKILWINFYSQVMENQFVRQFLRTVPVFHFWLLLEFIFYSLSQWYSLENQTIGRIDFHKKWHNYILPKQRIPSHSFSILILSLWRFCLLFSPTYSQYWCSHFIETILCCKLEHFVKWSVSIEEE